MENNKILSYRDLIVWQKSFALVKEIYLIASKLPKDEIFGFQSQMKRCSVSIPSNIAEGTSRSTRKDYKQFLHIAYGSCSELETQLLLAEDLFKIKIESTLSLLREVSRMLRAIIKKLETNP